MSFGLAGREAAVMDNEIVKVKIDHNVIYGYRRWGELAPNRVLVSGKQRAKTLYNYMMRAR